MRHYRVMSLEIDNWEITYGTTQSYRVATLSTTRKFDVTCQYCRETLEFDNCHLSYLRDALKAQVKHCLTKKTLTLRLGIEFGQILYC